MATPPLPSPPVPEPGEWTIDPANSSVGFAVRHMLVSRITGRFPRFGGHIVTAADLAAPPALRPGRAGGGHASAARRDRVGPKGRRLD
ncbi:YceI family protein, partial [Streptosporangium carneum]